MSSNLDINNNIIETITLNENDSIEHNKSCVDKLGFIVLRCVKKPEHNGHWNRCVASINQHYPECKIKMIDDYSNKSLLKGLGEYSNLEIIESEFSPGSGEMLPYYYYYTRGTEWFEQVVILHDSTLIQHRMQDCADINFAPLWNFASHVAEEKALQAKILACCEKNRGNSIRKIMANKRQWCGCFGAMSVIKHEFIRKVIDKDSLRDMTEIVKSRRERMAVERVIPCMMYSYDMKLPRNAIFGNIMHYPGHHHCPYSKYIASKNQWAKYPIVKFWCSR
jgi:hypothetical protein